MPCHLSNRFLAAASGALLLAASAGLAQPIVRKVLIVGVDGMRPDAMVAANAPTFDALIANGAVSYRCSAEDITVSGPGWSSITTGVHRNKHLVRDNSFVPQDYINYPHFFVRLQGLCEANVASICNWAPINTQILQGNADTILTGISDQAVADAAIALVGSQNPDVIFLHFDDCDGAGHGFGFSPTVPQYLAAIERTDAHLGRVLNAIRARPSYAQEDWLTIVTSDHGGTGTSHGQNIPEHRQTPLIVSGRSTAVGTIITPDPEIVDVPATVMTFLGLPINPAWGWDGQARGLNLAGATSVPFGCAPPPPPPVGGCCLADGRCVVLTDAQCTELRGTWAGLFNPCPTGGCELPETVLAEDFSGLALGPNVNETVAGANVWTPTPPAGWSVDRTGVPAGGVTEWRGWSFASRSWWSQIAGDQGRSGFTKGVGTIAVADPDEWDDLAHSPGTFNSTLTTRPISLAGMQAETARLFLDSSWRPEGQQAASITARFDGGAPVTLAAWTSVAGPAFKPDAVNETIGLPLGAPAGTQQVTLSFRLSDAGNNWWWALDNIQVEATPAQARRVLLSEDFEGVTLGRNVDETLAGDRVWSGSPPVGWAFDDTGVPGFDNPAVGVTEWKGWAVTNRQWWATVAGDQRRSEFTRGVGAVAVADPDEWDDRGSPAPSSLGAYNATMTTRPVSLEGIEANSLQVSFDSSWRPEGEQRAKLTAVFDSGPPTTVLLWDSVAGPTFKPDAPNERVSFTIASPPGARSVRLVFAMLNARNNWWWAVDNLSLTGRETACACTAADGRSPDFNCDGVLDPDDLSDYIGAFFSSPPDLRADYNGDGVVDPDDLSDVIGAYFAGC